MRYKRRRVFGSVVWYKFIRIPDMEDLNGIWIAFVKGTRPRNFSKANNRKSAMRKALLDHLDVLSF